VTFHPSLPEHAQRLMATLGVEVVFDHDVPERCECEEHQRARNRAHYERYGHYRR
jgi:hypothetical protein